MARNRTLRPVFPRLPFVFGTVSAERFADSFGCHCQHVLRHIDVTPLPRACVDQKPGTLCCQTAWHVFLHVLPTLIYHASVNVELCLPSFEHSVAGRVCITTKIHMSYVAYRIWAPVPVRYYPPTHPHPTPPEHSVAGCVAAKMCTPTRSVFGLPAYTCTVYIYIYI